MNVKTHWFEVLEASEGSHGKDPWSLGKSNGSVVARQRKCVKLIFRWEIIVNSDF